MLHIFFTLALESGDWSTGCHGEENNLLPMPVTKSRFLHCPTIAKSL